MPLLLIRNGVTVASELCAKKYLSPKHCEMILKFKRIERKSGLVIDLIRVIMCSTFFILSFFSFCQIANNDKLTNDSLVNKHVNEEFELNFHTFLDGGYIWVLESNDTTKIKLISKTSKSPKYISDTLGKVGVVMIGGDSVETWKFVGVQKGVYQLRFYYKRPQQNDIRRIKNVKVIIS